MACHHDVQYEPHKEQECFSLAPPNMYIYFSRVFWIQKLRVKKELARRNRLLDEAEERKAAAKQKEVDAYRATIGKEIELKKGIRAKEAAKLVEEQQQMALANAKFDANLKAVMGSSYQPPKHYRRKAVKWYF